MFAKITIFTLFYLFIYLFIYYFFTNTIPNEKTKYNGRVLLQIQSVYYNNNEDENYYPQVLLESC